MAAQYSRGRRGACLVLLPTCSSSYPRYVGSFCWGKAFGSGLAPFNPTLTLGRWMTLGFADGVISFARGNVHYELRKLVRIAGTFGHDPSMPQIYTDFETETLPAARKL